MPFYCKPSFVAIASSLLLFGCGQSQEPSFSSKSHVVSEPASLVDTTRKAAENGDSKAQLDLGLKYQKGEGVEKDLVAAYKWLLKSAENGNAEAMFFVGDALIRGDGVAKDIDGGWVWFRKSAEGENAEAQYRLSGKFGLTGRSTVIFGEGEEKKENARQYVKWLEKAASQSHKIAQYQLGMVYLLGAYEDWLSDTGKKLIEANPEKGAPLVKASADAGYWQAQWAMAVLYQVGLGTVKSDKEESIKYWKLLDEHSEPSDQYQIGLLYYSPSKEYYKAGKNKYQGRALNFGETNKVAFDWFKMAAEKGDGNAQNKLGTMYRDGISVFKDESQSFQYFKESAEIGNHDSMRAVAFAYLEGKGVVKDYREAHNWLLKAAQEDNQFKYSEVHKIRNAIGVLYEYGLGVEKDKVLAYAWYNVAASGGFDKAKQNLSRVEQTLNGDELREAQTLSREWEPGKQLVHAEASQNGMAGNESITTISGNGGKALQLAASGTGFFVTHDGNVLTNNHVIDGCREIRVPAEKLVGKLVVADSTNDLALIKLAVTNRPHGQFSTTDDIKQGEEIFVFGFPLDGFLPSSGNITPGIISALAGPGNNSSLVQMTAPVQLGNSGGPLLNKKGRIVGVVVGKANAIKIASVTGDIPQNINFAIAPRTVKSFLDANRVEYQKKSEAFSLDKGSIDIADEARKSSLKIECWR